jgi:hypothetical protein
VFALGVLTYHMFTGRIPFDDIEPEARKEVSAEGLPPLLYPVLLRAMTSRIRLRYPSIQAFMRDFQGAAQGQIDPDTERLFKVGAKLPPEDVPPAT